MRLVIPKGTIENDEKFFGEDFQPAEVFPNLEKVALVRDSWIYY